MYNTLNYYKKVFNFLRTLIIKRDTKEEREKGRSKKYINDISKIPMLELDNEKKYQQKCKCFGINNMDINKVRNSEKSLYSKQHNAYKYYLLYEHNNEYMPLRITLKDLVGYYDVYTDDKRMNIKINDELSDKIYQSLENIFEHIEKKLDITLNYLDITKNYFKIKVTDETCFN